MLRRFGLITDVFELTGRGCVVLVADRDMEPDVKLLIGDQVVIVTEGRAALRTEVRGIELGHRPGTGLVGVLLGSEVRKDDVSPGATLAVDRSDES